MTLWLKIHSGSAGRLFVVQWTEVGRKQLETVNVTRVGSRSSASPLRFQIH